MERENQLASRFQIWYRHHTQHALTQYQPRFWIIFWIATATGLVMYYLTREYLSPCLSQDYKVLFEVSCLSLPLWMLRNLHLQAFMVLGMLVINIIL